jgi:hypothetical protein
MSKVADGVVHFRVRAFATNGYPVLPDQFNLAAYYLPSGNYNRIGNAWAFFDRNEVDAYFFSNAVPAYVELELGILEPRIFEKSKALAEVNVAAARNYVSNYAANVHIFRQRIPIRSVDLDAYK